MDTGVIEECRMAERIYLSVTGHPERRAGIVMRHLSLVRFVAIVLAIGLADSRAATAQNLGKVDALNVWLSEIGRSDACTVDAEYLRAFVAATASEIELPKLKFSWNNDRPVLRMYFYVQAANPWNSSSGAVQCLFASDFTVIEFERDGSGVLMGERILFELPISMALESNDQLRLRAAASAATGLQMLSEEWKRAKGTAQ